MSKLVAYKEVQKQCKTCGTKETLFAKKIVYSKTGTRDGYKYANNSGQFWNGRECRNCTIRKQALPYDFVKEKYIKRGRFCERLVYEYLKKTGHNVWLNPVSKGPDIVLFDDSTSIEVKSVNQRKDGTYRVCGVKKRRKNDEIIVYVFTDNTAIFENMKEHLLRCDKYGSRSLTTIKNITDGKRINLL